MKGSGANSNLKILLIVQLLAGIAMMIILPLHLAFHNLRTIGRVQGILYGERDPMVVVDGKPLKEGDSIYGVTITRIHPDRVSLRKGKRCWTQRVGESPNPLWYEEKTTIPR